MQNSGCTTNFGRCAMMLSAESKIIQPTAQQYHGFIAEPLGHSQSVQIDLQIEKTGQCEWRRFFAGLENARTRVRDTHSRPPLTAHGISLEYNRYLINELILKKSSEFFISWCSMAPSIRGRFTVRSSMPLSFTDLISSAV
jgi:hypothetical protein